MRCRARASEVQRDAPAAELTLLVRVCDAAGFTLQLDEHQLKNILKDIHVKYAAETMEILDTKRDDLINFKQFVWLINGELARCHLRPRIIV